MVNKRNAKSGLSHSGRGRGIESEKSTKRTHEDHKRVRSPKDAPKVKPLYKHMSCVLGRADSDVARLLEHLQGEEITDSVFLRGIVYAFLIDTGYAKGKKDARGLGLKSIALSQKGLRKLREAP